MKRFLSMLVAVLALAAMSGIATADDRWDDRATDRDDRREMRREHRQDRTELRRTHRHDRRDMRREHRRDRREFGRSNGRSGGDWNVRSMHPQVRRVYREAMTDGHITPRERLMILRAVKRYGRGA